MLKRQFLVISFSLALVAPSTQVLAGAKCDLDGSYGYVYEGVSYDNGDAVEIAETGSFSVGRKSCKPDELCGTAKATFRFPDFPGIGRLWALVQLDFKGEIGAITIDPLDPCQGTVDFRANGTVIESSPVNMPNSVLFEDQARSIAYTVSGTKGEMVDLISTSPGSVLAGTAKARKKNKKDD